MISEFECSISDLLLKCVFLNKAPTMLKNAQLKKQLIKRIRDVDNGEMLNQIARIVGLEAKFDEIYIMSPEEI